MEVIMLERRAFGWKRNLKKHYYYRNFDFGLVRAKLLVGFPLHRPHELGAEIEVVLVKGDRVRVKCITFTAISENGNGFEIAVVTCTRRQDKILA